MNALLNSKNLPFFTLILGILGAGLRWLLYALTVDGRNLIPVGHPLEIILWIVTAAAAVLILWMILPLRNPENDPSRFRPCLPAVLGCLAGAAGIGLTVLLQDPATPGTLGLVWKVLGLASMVTLALAGFCRLRGREPFFGLHTVVCIFFAVHMVSCYRAWSSNPQLMDYVFSLFGSLGMMLFAFYHSCMEAGMPKLRLLPAAGLLAAYCCIVALSGTDYTLLYLCGSLWMLTNLCRLHTET